jgi:hypothetical protein
VPKELATLIGTDYFMFDVEEMSDGFLGTAMDLEVTAVDLDSLAEKAEQAVTLQWNELASSPLPGMLNWQRTLDASGFAPFRRGQGVDGRP